MNAEIRRRLPVGAELLDGRAHFRVWAPKRKRVEVVLQDAPGAFALEREAHGDGYFSGFADGASVGARYHYRLDGGKAFPDPASRFQPDGPNGPSQVVDASTFRWTDSAWRGLESERQIVYEMHVGTFTAAGTFAAAADELPELADLGITTIEVMPVAEFPGNFGWGYDGVDLFAPYHCYGSCDDLRALVNRAHEEGIGVILDVVYNHFGPDGNYLREFSDAYFNPKRHTDWGDAINYDGENSKPVRELVLSNVRHWVEEYHMDGLRLDATDNIYDDSESNLIAEIADTARGSARGRGVVILAENEAQNNKLLRDRKDGGWNVDMVWSDDFHHSAFVAATGRREAYFTDYGGSAQELISALKYGYLYQGQRYLWQDKRRGTPVWNVPRHRFVHFLENHDQVANSHDGRRLHQLTSGGRYRALTALLLLGQQTPLLFQGQEFGSSAPFLYFADHKPDLARLVKNGRAEFLSQFKSMADAKTLASLDDPSARRTFDVSKLHLDERQSHREHYALYRDLIAIRRCDPILSAGNYRIDGAVLGDGAFVLRFFDESGCDRLLVVNLGPLYSPEILPEPLLAPNDRQDGWRQVWHSEDPCYGGLGELPIELEDGSWRLPAESATLLASGDE